MSTKRVVAASRGGDRSAEPQLRRLLAAYDFLKQTAE
jgi:hypothetical protein